MGLASKTMTPRLSKGIDMRFHWLQDRIQRGQFRVQHVAGDVNVADFLLRPCLTSSTFNLHRTAPWILQLSATSPYL